MRPTVDGIKVVVPKGVGLQKVKDSVEQHRKELKDMKAKADSQRPTIDANFCIDTELLKLHFTAGNRDGFYVNRREGFCEIIYPASKDFSEKQMWLEDVITNELRIQAKAILSKRLYKLANENGFRFSSCKLQTSRTRWGSCSERNSINLSVFLMKLPIHLIDYVLLHELCHTRHHDHSPEFWALMDSVTDKKAHALRHELHGYKTDIY